ncbi:MAG TPA: hypothetical protein VNX68_04240 [Nitrosopumilaceae archaeon]|jgi:hypothetical protein|nr:hypothetical protein [Nitrosopumilaceae archaeon]
MKVEIFSGITPEHPLELLDYKTEKWNKLDIPHKFKTKDNYITYCQFYMLGLDADVMFKDKINELLKN